MKENQGITEKINKGKHRFFGKKNGLVQQYGFFSKKKESADKQD